MKKQQGFTLIELMIVVAIIGILAAIAIPAYQDYTIRAQVSEGMSLASGAKTAVAEFFQDSGEFPADNATAGVSEPTDISGQYASAVTVAGNGTTDATITVAYAGPAANNNLATSTLVLTATPNVGSIAWTCQGGGDMEQKWLPSACRTAAAAGPAGP